MALTNCPNCGACFPPDKLFCEYCGTRIVPDRYEREHKPETKNQGNKVNVTFPVIPGKMLINCARVEAFVKNVKVFEGGFKEVTSTFELSEPTNILIKISRWPDKTFKYPIEPGKNYELVLRVADSGFGFDVDFKQKIDSIKLYILCK